MDRSEVASVSVLDRRHDGASRPTLAMPAPRVAAPAPGSAPRRPARTLVPRPPPSDADDSGWMTAPPSITGAEPPAEADATGPWVLGVASVVASALLLVTATMLASALPVKVPASAATPARIDAGFAKIKRDPAAAAATFRYVLAASPHLPSARFGLGEAELALGHLEEALDLLCPLVREPGVAGASAASVLEARHLIQWCR